MFPPEFNLISYKNNNQHLNSKNNDELIQHYSFYGCNEGLISTTIHNRDDFINLIPTNKMILKLVLYVTHVCQFISRMFIQLTIFLKMN